MKSMRTFLASVTAATLLVHTMPGMAQAYKKADKTSQDLAELAEEVAEGVTQIGIAMTNLNTLVKYPGPDMRKQFSAYDKSVKKLTSIAASARKRRLSANGKRDELFKAWDAEIAKIQNEDIRARSAQRRQQVQGEMEKLASLADEVGTAYKAFESDAVDIQKYLSADLTPGGVAAIESVAKSANSHAAKVQKALTELSAQLDKIGLSMSTRQPKSKT